MATSGEVKRLSPWQNTKAVLSEPVFWRFTCLITLLLGVRAVSLYMHLLMPKYWMRVIGPDASIGILESINPFLVIIGLILLIPILHRFSVYKMLVYGAMVSAISLFIMAVPIYGDFAFTAPAFGEAVWNYTYLFSITALVVLTIGEVIWSPRLTEYTAAIAPPGQEGTYLGLSMVPYFAAKTLVSLASGFMLARWVTEPPEEDPLFLRRRLEAGEISFWDGPSGMWMMLAVIAFAGPLVALLLRGWLSLVGASEFAARHSSLIFGVLAVPLTWVVGRRIVGRATGAIGAMLVTLSPYLVWYSQELKMYSLVLALGLLSIYFYRRALDEGRWQWWVGHVITTSLMMYTHILAVLILVPQGLWFVVGWRKYRARWRGWLVAMAALTLPYLPLAAWQGRTLFSDFQTGHPFYSLGDMVHILFLAFSRGAATPWESVSMGVFLFLLLAGLVLREPGGYQSVLALVLWLVVPILGVYLISLGMPIFTDRYLIYVAPAYALLLGRGLVGLGRQWRPAQILAAVLLVFFLIQGWRVQAADAIKSDFRSAARLVTEHHRPDDLIVFQIPYGLYTFEYYYRQPFEQAEGLYTNHDMSEAEANRQMQAMTAGRQTV